MNNNQTSRITRSLASLMLIGGLMTGLTSCQLARPEASASGEDVLIGFYVTPTHLDLGDLEAFLSEHPEALSQESTPITLPASASGKIFARLEPGEETVSPETGLTFSNQEFVFSDLAGIPFFVARMTDPNTGETYTSTHTAPGIEDTRTDIHYSDAGEKVQLEGTIFLDDRAGEHAFYPNPVYQTRDGQVYLTAGTGISSSSEGAMAGFSKQIESTVTWSNNGQTRTMTSMIKINFAAKHLAQRIVLHEMDASHHLLASRDIDLTDIPGSLAAAEQTAYLILEEHLADGTIQRSLLESGRESFSIHRPSDLGILIGHPVRLNWPAP